LHTPIDHATFRATWGSEPYESGPLLVEYAKTNTKDMLALKSALLQTRTQEIGELAHRIGGAAQLMGATGIVDSARLLEDLAGGEDSAAIKHGVDTLCREIELVHAYINAIQAQ
jgi:HPt (histidine-containing phosphotransfer) domain-containing protein